MLKYLHKEIDILRNHNKQHIGAVEATVEDYAGEFATNVKAEINTYLSKAGLPAGNLADQAFNAALNVIKEAFPASQTVAVKTPEPVAPAPAPAVTEAETSAS